MQAINRIQNAMINANANQQGAMVVGSANAHRAYPSLSPCDTSPVSKFPGQEFGSSTSILGERLLKRPRLTLRERGHLAADPTGRKWRLDSHLNQMPATLWAAFVLNRKMCG